ncbi:MAG: hypothetical protein IAI50_11860 [Candidatus Eremiobacteraeota bacterium]|nr:hypothetical protein [Candidatus Eremiobacteraeota bacterium]
MTLTFLLSALFHLFNGASFPQHFASDRQSAPPDTSGAITGSRARAMDGAGVLTGLKVRSHAPQNHKPATVKVMDSSGVITG